MEGGVESSDIEVCVSTVTADWQMQFQIMLNVISNSTREVSFL